MLVPPRCGWGVRHPGYPAGKGKVGRGQIQENPGPQLQKLDFLLWAQRPRLCFLYARHYLRHRDSNSPSLCSREAGHPLGTQDHAKW